MKELQSILARLSLHTSGSTAGHSVLATLVQVEGSSYRRVGARLLWNEAGLRLGSISGGCLEEDLLLRARRVLASGDAETAVYDTTDENDSVWGVGLGCHGVVHVLLERVSGMPGPLREVQTSWARRKSVVLVSRYDHPDPRQNGTIAAFTLADGSAERSGGAVLGEFDAQAVESAFAQRASVTVRSGSVNTGAVLYEFLPPPLSLFIWGAGDDVQPLVRLAKELGWHLTVADPRSAYATRERFPEADEVRVEAEPVFEAHRVDERTVAVIMSHHYRFDVPALRILLPLPLIYLGLLGPRKRAEKILSDLVQSGLTIAPSWRERLRAPVGFDIGASTPEQVALAIVAEIEAVVNARDGRPLRERQRPIHG